MATVVIGDVHGNSDALNDLLRQLRRESDAADTIVFLGDYIDRGPDSRGCVEAILRFQEQVLAEVVCLCGNHEDWLLRTLTDFSRHSWLLGMEAFDTIRSYSVRAEHVLRDAVARAGPELVLGDVRLPYDVFFESVPREHLEFFQGLRTYHRSVDALCTHAGVDPGIPCVQEQPRDTLLWGAAGFPDGYTGAEVIVYGHWNNAASEDGWPHPLTVGASVGIDTISHGVLTAIRLPDRLVFQSGRHRIAP